MAEDNDNARAMTTIRLPKKVLKDSGDDAKARGWSRTHLIEELLVAYHEGRLTVTPRPGPSAFPGDDLVATPHPPNLEST
jgi:hypothetical protein